MGLRAQVDAFFSKVSKSVQILFFVLEKRKNGITTQAKSQDRSDIETKEDIRNCRRL